MAIGIVVLPMVGIVLYFFFGQNTRKEKLISKHSMDQLTKRSMLEFAEQKDIVYPEQCQQLITLFYNQSTAYPFKDNEVDIYTTGHDFFLALLQEIGKAKNTYILNFISLKKIHWVLS